MDADAEEMERRHNELQWGRDLTDADGQACRPARPLSMPCFNGAAT